MAPAPGITRDPRGVMDTPRSGVPTIDANVQRLQAEDTARLAAANKKVEAERPTERAPNATPGG